MGTIIGISVISLILSVVIFKNINSKNNFNDNEVDIEEEYEEKHTDHTYVHKSNQDLIKRKGYDGEDRALAFMEELKPVSLLINDLFIKTSTGYHQIDHVVIAPFGIFVIETKNYEGSIFGKEDDHTWTQFIHGKKYRFYNPIKQNQGHVNALFEVLSEELKNKDIIKPITVFVGNADINNVNTKSIVVPIKHLVGAIKENEYRLVFDKDKQRKIYNLIHKHNIKDETLRQVHIQEINSYKKN